MLDFTPHVLVSLIALGMGLAFLSADRISSTSRALALAMGSLGISIFLNVTFINGVTAIPPWSGWLALPEAVALIAVLEWLLRVRHTIPAAPGMNVAAGDYLLRIGQLAGLAYFVLALIAPDTRAHYFLRAAAEPGVLRSSGFWMFATPIVIATLAGLASIILLLNRRPDRPEKLRVLAMAAATPFFLAGFVLPLNWAAVLVTLGEMIFMIGAVHYHVLQGQRGQFLSRFLSPQVARLVSERGLRSAMQENYLEITVICCDLRGFTAYAQAHPSSRVIQVLREYYDAVGVVVADFGATIKDFAGDGVLILAGAPLPMHDHALRGLEIARRIRAVCSELTPRWSDHGGTLGIGLGVASGAVTVGIIGSASRLEYTAVGSAVNLASRLCEQAGDGEILLDRRTLELAGLVEYAEREPLRIKGFAAPVLHYGLP